MKTVEEIVALYRDRHTTLGPVLQQMREVRRLANGEVVVPLSELDRTARSSVANLFVQGLDQMAMRVTSTQPTPYFPALREGQDRSMQFARDRKRAMLSIWDQNRMGQKDRRRARNFFAYSSAPVFLKPNFDKRLVEWHLRNPLDTFAAPVVDESNPVPENVIFTYSRSYQWLMRNYGFLNGVLRVGDPAPDDMFTVLEYVDDMEVVLVVLGYERDRDPLSGSMYMGRPAVELSRVPNRCGMSCPWPVTRSH